MRDSFIHTIRELQDGDSTSQALINLNKPLHSNQVSLLKLVSQLVISKQPIHLIT
jgi:hypothetical protein